MEISTVIMLSVIALFYVNWMALVYALDSSELRNVVRRDSGVIVHCALIGVILLLFIPLVLTVIFTQWFESRLTR